MDFIERYCGGMPSRFQWLTLAVIVVGLAIGYVISRPK